MGECGIGGARRHQGVVTTGGGDSGALLKTPENSSHDGLRHWRSAL